MMRYDLMLPSDGDDNEGRTEHMRRIVLISATIVALAFPGVSQSLGQGLGQSLSPSLGQSEEMTVERLSRPGNRTIFVSKAASDDMPCQTVDAREITPQKAPRLGRTVLAEALVYTDNTLGYVFLISYANGPQEVYFASYTKRNCVIGEVQSHGRVFVGDDRFKQARIYYHSLFNELTE
jgi:hypothetical protein